MNRVNIGELDTKVTFRACTISRGASGEKVRTVTTYGDAFARVDRLVSEVIGDDNLEAGQTLTLTTYKVPGLTTRWQVVIAGKLYEITGIDAMERMSPFFSLTLHAIDG